VNRFGGVQEKCGRAGAGQRRGDLPRDDARLAHASDDHAASTVAQQFYRADETAVEAVNERENGRSLRLQDLARQGEIRQDGTRRAIRTLGRWHR
jgi:hypothetical protein